MTNPNQPQPNRSEHVEADIPTANEALLDNERILTAQSTLDQLKTIEDRRDLDEALQEALVRGDIPAVSPEDDTLVVATKIDPSQLRDTFLTLWQETTDDPHAKASADDGVFTDRSAVVASYASSIVANNPHPESLYKKMNEKFTADNPDADDQQKADFEIGLDYLAALLYGDRFDEYENQLGDLALEKPNAEYSEKDEQNRQVDMQILGRDFRVRRTIDAAARDRKDKWAMFKATNRNRLATPKLLWHEFRLSRAEDKLTRKKDKHADKQESANHTKNNLLRQLRQRRADSYKERVVAKHEQKRDDRLDLRNGHKRTMDKRIDDAKDTAERNAEEYREKIEGYKFRKQAAMAQRELRRTMKREQGAKRSEVNAILESLSPEQMQRIGRVACLKESARREVDKVDWQRRKTTHDIQESIDSIRKKATQIADYANVIAKSPDVLDSIDSDKLPSLQDALNEANEKRVAITDVTSAEYIEAEKVCNTLGDELAVLQNTRALIQQRLDSAVIDKKKLEKENIDLANKLSELRDRADKLDDMRKDQQSIYEGRDAAFKRTVDNTTVNS